MPENVTPIDTKANDIKHVSNELCLHIDSKYKSVDPDMMAVAILDVALRAIIFQKSVKEGLTLDLVQASFILIKTVTDMTFAEYTNQTRSPT